MDADLRSILITGGAGFVGCRLARELVDSGAEVLVLDSLHPQVHTTSGRPAALPDEATLWPVDVTDAGAWDAVFKLVRPSAIVHLAAETGTAQSLREGSRHGRVNVVGTTELLDALSRADHVPDHLVLSSTRAVYGEGEWEADGERYYPAVRRHDDLACGRWDPAAPSGAAGRPLPSVAGTTRPEPTSVYGATKLAQEHVLRAWGAATGCPVSILRCQNIYGVGQSLTNPYTGVLSLFARLALAGETLPVYEDGKIVRDFVYVADVVSALAAALASPPPDLRTLDIGSGTSTTIGDVARALAAIADAPAPKVTGQFRDGDVRAASCRVDDAVVDLGYAPTWDLERGLNAVMEWVGSDMGV